jgi:pimeloyl-ACP methyl ester carboxylesterase
MRVRVLLAALAVLACILSGPAAADHAGPEPTLRVAEARVAGTTVAWAAVGSGAPLLLLNGTGSPMAEWDPDLLSALATGRRVIVFDYLGLGLSGPAPGRISMRAMARMAAQLIRALHLGRVDVLGWSMGGFIAQQLARHHPVLVRRLVLAATNPGGPHTVLGPRWVQRADSDPHGGISTYLRTNYPDTRAAQSAGRAFIRRLRHAARTGAYPVERVPARTYRAMVRAEDPWLRHSANAKDLASLANPSLVITGRRDVITPPANSRFLARHLPEAQLTLVPGCGHSFLFQRPRTVARRVLAFLDRA